MEYLPIFEELRESLLAVGLVPLLARRLYPHSWRKRWRFYVRVLAYPRLTLRWFAEIWLHPQLRRLAIFYPALWEKPHRPYFRSDLHGRVRTRLLLEHYRLVRRLGLEPMMRRLRQRPLLLAHYTSRNGTPFEARLEVALGLEKEGELKLVLVRDGKPLALLTFLFVEEHGRLGMAIGGLQGDTCADQDTFRAATHELESLRPKDALIHVVRFFGAALGVINLRAVCNDKHIYRAARYRRRHDFTADYDRQWDEMGAQRDAGGDYVLAIEAPRRELCTIASKKRAQYLRKRAVLDALAAQVAATVAVRS